MAIKISGTTVIDDFRNAVNLTDITASGNVQFTSTGGIEIPSGTTAQRPLTPSAGTLRFNTDLSSLEIYDPNLGSFTGVGGGSGAGKGFTYFIATRR